MKNKLHYSFKIKHHFKSENKLLKDISIFIHSLITFLSQMVPIYSVLKNNNNNKKTFYNRFLIPPNLVKLLADDHSPNVVAAVKMFSRTWRSHARSIFFVQKPSGGHVKSECECYKASFRNEEK